MNLEPLDRRTHGPPLFDSLSGAPDSAWTYMSFGPFRDYRDFESTLEAIEQYPDWVPFAIVVADEPLGFASYLRIAPRDGSIEIGSIMFSPQLQRTTPATEALYLMMRNVFELEYRRCEWKCGALNAPSRKAAERLGFTYEGTFRQATLYKGRTATPPGMPSPTGNGPTWTWRSKDGCRQTTSTATAHNSVACARQRRELRHGTWIRIVERPASPRRE